MELTKPSDLLEYLTQELPGYEFKIMDQSGPLRLSTLQARTTLRLGVEGDIDVAVFPLPEHPRVLQDFAKGIIDRARHDAAQKTGMLKVWDEREKELHEEFAREYAKREKSWLAQVGKAYLDGKAAGQAGDGGEDDDGQGFWAGEMNG